MENPLKTSKKMLITDCRSYEKDGTKKFILEYITRKSTGKTFVGKDGKEKDELKKSFENLFISRSDLPKEFDKISDDEICQVLKGKSLVRATILTD